MNRKTLNRMTPQRRAWLEQLLLGPASRSGRGNVGCSCYRLGWTEWVQDNEGNIVDGLEQLTEAGRAALRRGEGRG